MLILMYDEPDGTWTVRIEGIDPVPHPIAVERDPVILGKFLTNLLQLKDYDDEQVAWALHEARLAALE